MLAMRDAQPCVVHGVGGLSDTVSDLENGFVFRGDTPTSQADNFVNTVRDALDCKTSDTDRWLEIRRRAAAARFSWAATAQRYIEHVYERTE